MWCRLRPTLELISFHPKWLILTFLLAYQYPLYAQKNITTYRLAGVQLSTDKLNSVAFIESKQGLTSAYRIKDVIGHCLLIDIAQNHAKIICDNKTMKLSLKADPIALPVVPSSSLNTEYIKLDRSTFSTLYKDKQRFVNDIDMEMVVQENQLEGIKLYHRHEISSLRATGIQDGDIVREVNGYAVMQTDKVIEQFSLLNKQQFDQLTLLITRNNTPMMLVLQFN